MAPLQLTLEKASRLNGDLVNVEPVRVKVLH